MLVDGLVIVVSSWQKVLQIFIRVYFHYFETCLRLLNKNAISPFLFINGLFWSVSVVFSIFVFWRFMTLCYLRSNFFTICSNSATRRCWSLQIIVILYESKRIYALPTKLHHVRTTSPKCIILFLMSLSLCGQGFHKEILKGKERKSFFI